MASVSVKVVPKTGFLSRFSLFKRSQEKFSFDYQVKCVEKAISDVQILQSIPFSSTPQQHLTTISNEIKPKLSDIANESLAAKLSLIHGVLSKNISDYEEQVKETLSTPLDQPVDEDKQAATLLYYRLVFTRNYLKSLEQAVKKGDIPANSLDKKIVGILDCSLRGTSSERVLEHLNLYGTQIQQDTLQLAFYTLYEPEIQTTASLLPLYPFQRQKKQTKINAKLASTYLLDKLELNTKTRCVFAWSDPNFTGFKPLPDEFLMSTTELTKGRRNFFPEGDYLSKSFLNSLKGNLREEENTHNENKENMRNGAYFFVATCLLDWLVCSV